MGRTWDDLAQHYKAHLGAPTRQQRFHRGPASVGVWTWSPETTGEGVWLHASFGASEDPATRGDHTPRHELYLGITQDLPGVDTVLAGLAAYEQQTGNPLHHGHTVPSDDPLWQGTDMRAILVVAPRVAIVPPLLLSNGVRVVFLMAIPLHPGERDYKSRTSAEQLLQEFERRAVPFWDGTRAACSLS